MPILLSYKRLHLWHSSRSYKLKVHHFEYGYGPENDLFYSDRVYLRNGVKVARMYIDGIGFQQKHAIFHLR